MDMDFAGLGTLVQAIMPLSSVWAGTLSPSRTLTEIVRRESEYWLQWVFYGGFAVATLAFGYASLARVLGLTHLEQKVDLIERSIR